MSKKDYSEIIKKEIGIFSKARLRIIDRASREIFSNLNEIKTHSEFNYFINPFDEIKNTNNQRDKIEVRSILRKINFLVFELIYSQGSVNDRNWEMKEENMRKLIHYNNSNNFVSSLQQIISSQLLGIISGNTIIKTRVNNSNDIKLFIESWLSLGMKLNWNFIKERLENRLTSIKDIEKRLEFKDYISKIITIMDKFANLMDDIKTEVNFTKKEIKIMFDRRSKRSRVSIDGKHHKDKLLMILFNKLNTIECRINDENCLGNIDVFHTIPLKYGLKLGGVDAAINYQILCEYHNDNINFTEKLDKMRSDYERFDYLKLNYENIIKYSLTQIK